MTQSPAIYSVSRVAAIVSETVAAIQAADADRWTIAQHAAYAVGLRIPGLTAEIARQSAVSIDSIERHARAWVMLQWITPLLGADETAALRNRLTISHFWTAANLMKRHEVDVTRAIEWLQHASTERLSAEAMAAFAGDVDGDANDWRPVFQRFLKTAERLKTYPDLPPDLLAILRQIV